MADYKRLLLPKSWDFAALATTAGARAEEAATAATAAANSAEKSAASETNASAHAESAKNSAESAAASETESATSATASANSATSAATYAENAAASATKSENCANAAATSASNAQAYAENAAAFAGNITSITYAELKALRNSGALTAGMQYRITDYTCTTTQANTRSAGHDYDIIVIADTNNTLNENARACLHDGDAYFSIYSCALGAWKLQYCIDNDTSRFAWADETNGRGVVYRLIDENNNDIPYDFKNIQFYINPSIYTGYNGSSVKARWCFTFAPWQMNGIYNDYITGLPIPDDMSIMRTSNYDTDGDDEWYSGATYVENNYMAPYLKRGTAALKTPLKAAVQQHLNVNVFVIDAAYGNAGDDYTNKIANNKMYGDGCHDNLLVANSYDYSICNNTWSGDCYNNTWSGDCDSNTWSGDCRNNTWSGDCYNNTWSGDCRNNTWSGGCDSNTWSGDCRNNTWSGICYRGDYTRIGYCQLFNMSFSARASVTGNTATSTTYVYWRNGGTSYSVQAGF